VYILAWLVIPRAEHWPPPPPERTFRSLTGRDMGLALALFGIVLALAVGIGSSGGVLIPLVLVAGGVWLLIQPPSEVEPAVADGVSHRATGSPPPPAPQLFGPGPAGPLGAPVPPRSRRRVIALVSAFVIAILVLVVTPLVLIGGAVYHFSDGFEDPPTISYTPTAIDTEPVVFDEESADLVIDLTGIDASDFAGADQPLKIRADVEFGEITVLVPTGVDASVDADATLGDVRVFGQTDDGYRPRITHREPEAEIELELDLRFGQIDVQYAAG
jgi:hypothetical protein